MRQSVDGGVILGSEREPKAGQPPPLVTHLEARRQDLEEAIFARVRLVTDRAVMPDPEDAAGLSGAVTAAVTYAYAWISQRDGGAVPVPPILSDRARRAAHLETGLDTVLRRYFLGFVTAGDALIESADDLEMSPADVRPTWRQLASAFDCLIGTVADEYASEGLGRDCGFEQGRAIKVRKLLAGDPLEADEIGYELDGWHVGLVASGSGSRTAIRELARACDSRALIIPGGPKQLWAWLGRRGEFSAADVIRRGAAYLRPTMSIGVGESGAELAGWRLTHRQARAAALIAEAEGIGMVGHRDVALLAAAYRDDILAESLRRRYVVPLQGAREGGLKIRETLLAYLAAGQNISAAASALGASRQTVRARLLLAEERVGSSLPSCAAELHTAMRLWRLWGS